MKQINGTKEKLNTYVLDTLHFRTIFTMTKVVQHIIYTREGIRYSIYERKFMEFICTIWKTNGLP